MCLYQGGYIWDGVFGGAYQMQKVAKGISGKRKTRARKNEVGLWIKNKMHGRMGVYISGDQTGEVGWADLYYASQFELLQVKRPTTFKQEDGKISFMYFLFCMKNEWYSCR